MKIIDLLESGVTVNYHLTAILMENLSPEEIWDNIKDFLIRNGKKHENWQVGDVYIDVYIAFCYPNPLPFWGYSSEHSLFFEISLQNNIKFNKPDENFKRYLIEFLLKKYS